MLKANVSLSQFSWKAVPQLRTCSCKTHVFLHSCCMFVSRRTSLMWQNAADCDLRRRPTDSRRPDRLESCRTVAGRPGWPMAILQSTWRRTGSQCSSCSTWPMSRCISIGGCAMCTYIYAFLYFTWV